MLALAARQHYSDAMSDKATSQGPAAETLQARLLRTMQAKGISQSELARRVGLTRASVNAYTMGRVVYIRPHNLFAIADALNVSARWLATGAHSKRQQTCQPRSRA